MFRLNFPELKDTQAKVEEGENYSAILTFPTKEGATRFFESMAVYEFPSDFVLQINDYTISLALEVASYVYAYPGADFSNIEDLNIYSGYRCAGNKHIAEEKQSRTEDEASEDETIEDKESPTISIFQSAAFFTHEPTYDNDKFRFKKEVICSDYYTDEECAKFAGKEKLDEDDKSLLAFLENCTSFRTLGFYLARKHGYDNPHLVSRSINILSERNGSPATLVPLDVIDFIESEVKSKNQYSKGNS